ncbi:MAG: hypothetical protein V3S39_06780 [Thermodesulfobacteriota bacterium]
MKVWLSLDGLIDDRLKGHSLTYWKDPSLKPVLGRCSKLQLTLARLPAQVKKKAQSLVCREMDKLIQTMG